MDENELRKHKLEGDCPRCGDIQPWYWDSFFDGEWACKCSTKSFPKITEKVIKDLNNKLNFDN